jgi:hypothetical protein
VVRAHRTEEHRRPLGGGFDGVDHHGKGFDLDQHRLRRVDGDGTGGRHDHRHGLAHEAHDVTSQHRPGEGVRGWGSGGKVGDAELVRGEHAGNTRKRRCLVSVDGYEAAVGDLGTDECCV